MKRNNELPRISIIVPVFNAEKHLNECLDSIIAQTFTDYELILVNDGSPDTSGDICDSYALKDSRIRVIHKDNGGASNARNVGIEAARGKYIGWVDADDQIVPEMYEKLYQIAEDHQADIADCQYYMINGGRTKRSGKEEPVVSGKGDFILKQFFSAQMKPSLWTKLYKRELWHGIKFPEGRKHQDYYINMCFALQPLKYVRTPEPLYYYIVRKNSITTTYSSFEIRQAIYLYEFTMNLAKNVDCTDVVKKYLTRDAINRMIGRHFEVSVNSNLKNLYIYNYYIKKKLGLMLIKYILTADLPFKKRISYLLVLSNLRGLQVFLHKYLGK